MPSMMAILRQTNWKSALKHWNSKGEIGEVLPFWRYILNQHTEKLSGGSLFLVTVEPNNTPEGTLWLVATYEKTKRDKSQGIWKASPKNQTPITDITYLKDQLKFESGNGIRGELGMLGQELQRARVLTPEDEKLLRDAIKEATQEPPEETEPEASEFPEGKKSYVHHVRRERSGALVELAKQEHKKASSGALPCSVCTFDFAKEYGAVGENFAEVHHTIPLLDYEKLKKETTQVSDLVVVCSNCHRMLHRRRPWLTLDELKKLKSK